MKKRLIIYDYIREIKPNSMEILIRIRIHHGKRERERKRERKRQKKGFKRQIQI
jgi:hypothetical protein